MPPGSKRRTLDLARADPQVELQHAGSGAGDGALVVFAASRRRVVAEQPHRSRAGVRVHLDPHRARDEDEQLADADLRVDVGRAAGERDVAQVELELDRCRARSGCCSSRAAAGRYVRLADAAAQRYVDRVRDRGRGEQHDADEDQRVRAADERGDDQRRADDARRRSRARR